MSNGDYRYNNTCSFMIWLLLSTLRKIKNTTNKIIHQPSFQLSLSCFLTQSKHKYIQTKDKFNEQPYNIPFKQQIVPIQLSPPNCNMRTITFRIDKNWTITFFWLLQFQRILQSQTFSTIIFTWHPNNSNNIIRHFQLWCKTINPSALYKYHNQYLQCNDWNGTQKMLHNRQSKPLFNS